MKIGIGIAFFLAVGCQKSEEIQRDPGTDRAITTNVRSAQPAVAGDGESESDRDISRQIRQALVNHDKLSEKAKNVQVATKDGVVTLRGTVDNASEKALLAELAQGAPGVSRIDNHLTLGPE